MTHSYKYVVLAVALTLLSSLIPSTALAQDPAKGKTTWEQTGCQKCHGGVGEGNWAGPLAGTEKTAAEFITQVRTPRNRMLSYTAAQLSDEMITDIQAYLASLPKPTTDFVPAKANLPADAPAGQTLMAEKKCVACHTETGPVGGFVKRGEMPTAEAVIKQLRTPKKFMGAYSATQVSDEEAGKIAAFLAVEFTAQQTATTTAAVTTTDAATTTTAVTTTAATTTTEMATPAATTAPAAAPATMPQSGANHSTAPWGLLMVGGLLALGGLVLRRLTTAA
jgi:mono/diheme cytochrome c family protein